MTAARRPRTALLSPAETEHIIEDACRVLEQVGVIVENPEGARLLREAGATERSGRLLIPETAVRAAVASAPGRIELFARDGSPALVLADDNVHFDPGSAAIYVLDGATGRRRPAVSADVVDLARLVDGLPHFAAQSTALVPGDVPDALGDRYRLYLALLHGRKPVITGTFTTEGFAPMRRMLEVFRRDAEDLRARPLAVFDCCPSPPLRWSDLTCRSLIDCARAGIPAELISMPLTGATSPVTLRHTVVQHCAENLSGAVLHQTACPGAPLIYGGAAAAFDMRFGSTPMGAMETMMIAVAYAQVGKALDLPTHGYLGLSDAKTPDYQGGMESGIGAVLAALAGINVVSGAGILDYILTQSLEKILLDHEACGLALRLIRGISEQDEDPVTLLGELVAAGEFLSHRHTREHWKEELTVASGLIDRDSFGDWEAKGGQTAAERAHQEVRRRLARHPGTPATETEAAELRAIMTGEAARHGLDALPA